MNKLHNLDRKQMAVVSLCVAVIFLFFLNILATGEIRTAQLDLTENKLFTLSQGTKEVVKAIDEPLTFRFYYSNKFGEISPVHGNYAKRVQEFLEQLELISNGKIQLKVIHPDPFSVEEDEAVKMGIQGVPLDQSAEMGYFGLAANNSTDDRKSIPFFNPQREQFLEYDLTRIVFELASPKKKKIGLITGLLLEADPLLQYKPWPIIEQITQFFEIQSIDSSTKVIPEDIELLLLVHPRVNSEAFRYAIDQFAMRGGRILAFLDPQNETARMSPQTPPGAGSSDLKNLFDTWGIEFDPDKFVGDRTAAVRVSAKVGGQDVIADYLSYNVFQNRSLNQEDVITAQLNTIQLARFSGQVKSTFPEGPPPLEKSDKGSDDKSKKPLPPHLNESNKDLNMIVLADTDLLTSRFWVREQDFFGQRIQVPVSNNADFLVNSLENLSGSQALISLRSRGLSIRPFYRIKDLATAAEEKYRSTEQTLSAKLKDLQKKISGLNTGDKADTNIVLTSEQSKAFQTFRIEMLGVRKKLREVQHNLRKDIENLDTTLKILNIWTVPVIVTVLAGILAIIRRRRYNQPQLQG